MSYDKIIHGNKIYHVNLDAGTKEYGCRIPEDLWAFVLAHNPRWAENIRREAAREYPPYYRSVHRLDGETYKQAEERIFANAEEKERKLLREANKNWRRIGAPEFDNVIIEGITIQEIMERIPTDIMDSLL